MRRLRWLVPIVVAVSLFPAATTADIVTDHRIDVRTRTNGTQELFDRATGRRFVPRGVQLLVKGIDGGVLVDTLFGTQTYDPAFVNQTFADLQDRGYNTVRVFLDLCLSDCIGDPAGGVRGAYLANVADLLRSAKQHGLFVVLASNDLPDGSGYGDTLPCCDPFGGYRNSAYLSSRGVETLERYWTDIVSGLMETGAPLQNVLAYELVQEWFVLNDVAPLSLDSGTVKTADGKIYDMSSQADRRRMIEQNLLHLIRKVRSAIVDLDPTALVTVGFFPPPSPAEIAAGENRLLYTSKAIRGSGLDLVDLHAYPGNVLDLPEIVDRFGATSHTVKPTLMGEFGGFRFAYPSPLSAAEALAKWQADSCRFGFDGWALWLWAETDDEVWGGHEGGGEIADVLSPATRPNPCSAAALALNLSLDATATSTASLPDEGPELAIDGVVGTSWVSGLGATQSIEIDLGVLADVERVELAVSQFPAGATVHQLYGRAGAADPWVLLQEFSGSTAEGEWLVFAPASPLSVRQMKVETILSPSWVSWREIRVVGRPA